MSEFDDTARDNGAVTATARLPGLAIEIVHRRAPEGDGEQISIYLQATPSFEAFGRFTESMNPFAFWAQAMQMAWLTWLAAAQVLGASELFGPPGSTFPQIARDGTRPAGRGGGPG